MPQNLLIVDDNERVFESLDINFRHMGFNCLWAAGKSDALRVAGENRLAAAIIDLSLEEDDGIDVMQALFKTQSDMPAIVITGFGSFEAAVRAIKLGAHDFLAKPLNFEKLNEILQDALKLTARAEAGVGRRDVALPRLVSRSLGMLEVWEKAAQVAGIDVPVLVTGESGTGKELVAERIHACSPRREGPFVRVNCSAIVDTLADSELFGHRRGAFTGAADGHVGLFRQAHGGTLHMDEGGDMSLATQAKLLRTLEDGRIRPLGSEQEVTVDVRIVTSTNKDLSAMVADGRFRGDLYYRLNAVQLHLSPLRERIEDIPPLIEHFLRAFAENGTPKRFSGKAMRLLTEYHWPGNVRELRNAVKVCAAITPGAIIEDYDLPVNIRAPQRLAPAGGRLTDAEREVIARILEETGGGRQATARRLGISRRTLYNKMKRHGLE